MKYKHIFFDLDDTLWDFARNSKETLIELFGTYQLANAGNQTINTQDFLTAYYPINLELWKLYREDAIDHQTLRTVRFERLFEQMGVANHVNLAHRFSKDYLSIAPTKPHLCPFAKELLDYLKDKYQLHIITNGFPDVQSIKMASAQLESYFDVVVTSGSTGYKKPSPQIFEYALEKANAQISESIMIGDSLEADIAGARNVSLDHIFYNPLQKTHQTTVQKEVHSLEDLLHLF